MATLDTGLLALIIFLAICICGLFFTGIYNIRQGLQSESQVQGQEQGPCSPTTNPTSWHKQPKVLFGLNNMTFALLLLDILLLSLFTAPTVHYVLFGLLGLIFILSIVLLVRMMAASFAMVRNLQPRPSQAKPKIDEQRPS